MTSPNRENGVNPTPTSRVGEHVQDSTAALELLTGLRLTTFVMA